MKKCLFLVAVYTVFILLSVVSDTRFIHFADDIGLSFAVAEGVLSGDIPLVGQPSHLGGRHLGPFYYWILAGILAITAKNTLLAVLVLSALKLIAFLIILVFTYNFDNGNKRSLAFVTTLVCLGFSPGILVLLQTPWVNHFLVLPCTLLLLCSWLCFKEGIQWLPVYLVAASLTVQTFFGAAPFIVVLTLGTIYICIKDKQDLELKEYNRIYAWLFVLCAVWLPLLVYELFYESNLQRLFTRHRSSLLLTDNLLQVYYSFQAFLARHSIGHVYLQLIERNSLFSFCIALVFALLLGAYFYKADRKQKIFISSLCGGIFATVIAVSFVEGPVLGFYFNMLIPSVCFLIGLIVTQALRFRYFVVPLILVVVFTIYNIKNIHTHLKWDYKQRSLSHIEQLAGYLKEQQSLNVRLFIRGKHYKRRNAVLYHLHDRQYYAMSYAAFFKELDFFRTVPGPSNISPRQRTKSADIAFLEVCNPGFEDSIKLPKRIALRWKLDSEVLGYLKYPPPSCKLYKLLPNSMNYLDSFGNSSLES